MGIYDEDDTIPTSSETVPWSAMANTVSLGQHSERPADTNGGRRLGRFEAAEGRMVETEPGVIKENQTHASPARLISHGSANGEARFQSS